MPLLCYLIFWVPDAEIESQYKHKHASTVKYLLNKNHMYCDHLIYATQKNMWGYFPCVKIQKDKAQSPIKGKGLDFIRRLPYCILVL
jgi:hypothetical protein